MPADEPTGDDGARSVKSRRDRLAAMRNRHQAIASGPAPRGLGGLARPGAATAESAKAGGRPGISPQQRQVMARVYRMLTQGPDDDSGKVPGTPFLRSGVERLMTLLEQRAATVGAPGAKVAQSALRFIEAKEGEDAVGGASTERLRMLAGRVESLRSRAGANR